MQIEPIGVDREVETILTEARLPVADLADGGVSLFGVRDDGRLVAVVGVERYGEVGLLRSLAVVPARRAAGLGAALVACAERWAVERGVKALYLLTTTAAGFFAGRGYAAVPRSAAPAAIAATALFAGLCPASSTFMRKRLAANTHPGLEGASRLG